MSELSGMDAFENIMERLIGAERKLAAAEDASNNAAQRARLAEIDRDSALAKLARAEAIERKATPALNELWQAAEGALADLSDQGTPPGQAAKERLRKAINGAREFCDQIPF